MAQPVPALPPTCCGLQAPHSRSLASSSFVSSFLGQGQASFLRAVSRVQDRQKRERKRVSHMPWHLGGPQASQPCFGLRSLLPRTRHRSPGGCQLKTSAGRRERSSGPLRGPGRGGASRETRLRGKEASARGEVWEGRARDAADSERRERKEGEGLKGWGEKGWKPAGEGSQEGRREEKAQGETHEMRRGTRKGDREDRLGGGPEREAERGDGGGESDVWGRRRRERVGSGRERTGEDGRGQKTVRESRGGCGAEERTGSREARRGKKAETQGGESGRGRGGTGTATEKERALGQGGDEKAEAEQDREESRRRKGGERTEPETGTRGTRVWRASGRASGRASRRDRAGRRRREAEKGGV